MIVCTNCHNTALEEGFAQDVVEGPYWTTTAPGCCDAGYTQYEVVECA